MSNAASNTAAGAFAIKYVVRCDGRSNRFKPMSRSGHLYKSIDLRSLDFIELTIPDKPQSRNQKMRITEEGMAWLAKSNE